MGNKLIDEKGNRHGAWVVLERAAVNSKKGQARWLCRCDCGKESIVEGISLRKGNSRSCGCLRHSYPHKKRGRKPLPKGMAAFNALHRNYQRNAKKRGYEWGLTKDQFHELTRRPCYYCGVLPAQVLSLPTYNGAYIYNGVDRADNHLGYVLGNVVPCCFICNDAKGTKSQEVFLSWAIRIAQQARARSAILRDAGTP